MAHQTFYVGADEEITSIVEKLKQAQTGEIIMVVPKRALLIQSIINLRILKKEADGRNLQLMIVTQDKLGKILIEKAGILVQQKLDNNDEEINLSTEKEVKNETADVFESDASAADRNRLDNIGSDNFFDETVYKKQIEGDLEELKKIHSQKPEGGKEVLVNKELMKGISGIKQKTQNQGMDLKYVPPSRKADDFSGMAKNKFTEPQKSRDKVENFFYPAAPKEDSHNYSLPKVSIRWFWVFGIFCAIVVGFFAVYLFVPKMSIDIIAKTKSKTIDSEILGDVNSTAIDYEKEIIPARIITINKEISKSFESTGDKSVSNQKARGTVILYNEYSASSQPLVATTRLMAGDGKLFRLVNGVTIPGMTKSGEKNIAGQIEAEVVADQSGEEYNIDPATFTIPGFKDSGNEKYSKFYAKSEKKMAGGGSGADKVPSITQEDVNSAKISLAAELDSFIKSELASQAGKDAVFLDEAINKEEAVYKLSNSPGEVAETFLVTAEIKANAMVFSEKDIKNMAGKILAKAGGSGANINNQSIRLEYGKSDANFKANLINIKFHAEGKIESGLDLDKIKKEILGKNEDDLKIYLSEFKDIEKVDIEYTPSFVSGRVPFLASQVELRLAP